MERRLIKQGGGGYTIYLPKKWVEKNSLEKGNPLRIEESGDNLIISKAGVSKKTSTSIKLKGYTESSIRTLLTNVYRLGFDTIQVSYEDNKQFNILQHIIKTRLLGFEVVKKQEKSCIVENITEPSADQFENVLNKLFMNIEEMFVLTRKRMNHEKDHEDYREVAEGAQKYDNFCRRIIVKRKLIEQNSEMFWAFLTLIVHGNLELYHANQILDKKIDFSKSAIELLDGCEKIFKTLMQAYKTKNIEILQEIHESEKILIYKKAYSLLSNGKQESALIYQLASSVRRFYQAVSPLTGTIICI